MILPHDKAFTCGGCRRLIINNLEAALVVTYSPATPFLVATVHDDIDCLEAFRLLNPGWYAPCRGVLETVGRWRAGGVEFVPNPGGEDRGYAKLVVLESAA